MASLTMAKALNEGLARAMEADDKVVLLGQDIGKLGGVFRVTDGLQDRFGARRVMDSPLAEAGIVGTAIGMAARGYRTVCEIQFDGFVFPAYDQIVNQAAKLRYRSRGRVTAPIVIRIPYGGGIGAIEHHAESPEAHFAQTPGLRMVSPSTPQDAFVMIQQAVRCPDPVLFFEPKRQYHSGRGEVDLDDGEGDPAALSKAAVVRAGTDVTLIGYGPTVSMLLRAADALAGEGRSAEVIDVRSLAPVDYGTLEASVAKTGRVLIVHEAPKTSGLGAEIAARLTERCFYALEAPVLRAAGLDMPYPPSRVEEDYLPDLDRVLDGVDTLFGY